MSVLVLRDRLELFGLFATATIFMSLKPLLLHSTITEGGETMSPEHFQLAAEALKLCICSVCLAARRMTGLPAPLWRGVRHSLHFAITAAIYLVMNVLTVVAARALAPPVFQLVANLKIAVTAVASWLLLSATLSVAQWVALALLTVGVAMGQGQGDVREVVTSASDLASPGVLIMVGNCCLSALGGVSTELLLRGRSGAGLSIFSTNVHLAAYTLLLNSVFLSVRGLSVCPAPHSRRVLLALANEAANGLVISLLLRRLGTIAKNFAFSVSVFVTVGLSALLLGFRPQARFYSGAVITCLSVVLYSGTPARRLPHAEKAK